MEKRFASENLAADKQALADQMNLDESSVPNWSIPAIESKSAAEFLRTERPRLLKQFAEPLLFAIGREDSEYLEAKRLLKFLDYFVGVTSENLPNNSIIREFIGGSVIV